MNRYSIPATELRCGYYSDIYFWRERRILESRNRHPAVTMQVFQKQEALLCGVEEALEVFRVGAGRFKDPAAAETLFRTYLETDREPSLAEQINRGWEPAFDELEIRTLQDGDAVSPHETVMHISGEAALFAHLETVYLGILARRTAIATRVSAVVNAANGKPDLFFPARFEADGVSVDAYAVGSWFMQGGCDFTAVIVNVDGKPCAKVGRSFTPNPRLQPRV